MELGREMTRVKICGIKEKAHALGASRAGADLIGLVLAPSPRQVTAAKAQEIVAAVRKQNEPVAVVGVFVNMPAPAVNRTARDCNLDWVQLSGTETWAYCQMIDRPLIKVVHVEAGLSPEEIKACLAQGDQALSRKEHRYLLDSRTGDRYGGTGLTFDWGLAGEVAREFPVIVAGGLTPENVGEAVKVAAPWGVDVSSGVEVDGVKSTIRIKAFIEAVRRADASQE
jgi:phosphoribosylanthranilate isomerase